MVGEFHPYLYLTNLDFQGMYQLEQVIRYQFQHEIVIQLGN